jgi:hypothetical protein
MSVRPAVGRRSEFDAVVCRTHWRWPASKVSAQRARARAGQEVDVEQVAGGRRQVRGQEVGSADAQGRVPDQGVLGPGPDRGQDVEGQLLLRFRPVAVGQQDVRVGDRHVAGGPGEPGHLHLGRGGGLVDARRGCLAAVQAAGEDREQVLLGALEGADLQVGRAAGSPGRDHLAEFFRAGRDQKADGAHRGQLLGRHRRGDLGEGVLGRCRQGAQAGRGAPDRVQVSVQLGGDRRTQGLAGGDHAFGGVAFQGGAEPDGEPEGHRHAADDDDEREEGGPLPGESALAVPRHLMEFSPICGRLWLTPPPRRPAPRHGGAAA